MGQRYLRLIKEIEFEMNELKKIVIESQSFMNQFAQDITPSFLEVRGFGAILHDFYNGVENICKRIANEIDGGLPRGDDWHFRLLESMALELPSVRPALFTPDTIKSLDEFRRFRHVFRHTYGSHLDWKKINVLLTVMDKVFPVIEEEVIQFVGFLEVIG